MSRRMQSDKGKAHISDDDEDPILLPDKADENLIREYGLSLIGKILNPRKQNVDRLIVSMPEQWGLSERISACNLGNDRFLFNFDNEDDLQFVLDKGPFHYNFCMFVLVRWEPIVDVNYPSIIPFWIQLHGIPLHLCTEQNLMAIGGRLGIVENVDIIEGKVQVGIDSSKPLKFSRKLLTRDKENISIKLHYEMLFKHCSSCGHMSHELNDCSNKQLAVKPEQSETMDHRQSNIANEKKGNGMSRVEASSRVNIRGSHTSQSSRIHRDKPQYPRYSPYDYARTRDYGEKKEDRKRTQVWREKRTRNEIRPASEMPVNANEDVRRVSNVISPLDSGLKSTIVNERNITFRTTSDSRMEQRSGVDELIPPYDALKIGTQIDQEEETKSNGKKEDNIDIVMQEALVGNELVLVDEDDLMIDELELMKDKEKKEKIKDQPLLVSPIRRIGAQDNNDQVITTSGVSTRSNARSLVVSGELSRHESPIRASPRIKEKRTFTASVGRGRRGTTITTSSRSSRRNLQLGTADSKNPPKRQ